MTGIARPLATNNASGKAVVQDTPLERTIRAKLEAATGAEVLEVLNESRMHNVPPKAETHFRVCRRQQTVRRRNPAAQAPRRPQRLGR